jgi:hypothetical protein
MRTLSAGRLVLAGGASMIVLRHGYVLTAVVVSASGLGRVLAVESLPTGWRQGIATNYGGAQDGMVPYPPTCPASQNRYQITSMLLGPALPLPLWIRCQSDMRNKSCRFQVNIQYPTMLHLQPPYKAAAMQ